jgi:uncharacterized membrane protein YhdT
VVIYLLGFAVGDFLPHDHVAPNVFAAALIMACCSFPVLFLSFPLLIVALVVPALLIL